MIIIITTSHLFTQVNMSCYHRFVFLFFFTFYSISFIYLFIFWVVNKTKIFGQSFTHQQKYLTSNPTVSHLYKYPVSLFNCIYLPIFFQCISYIILKHYYIFKTFQINLKRSMYFPSFSNPSAMFHKYNYAISLHFSIDYYFLNTSNLCSSTYVVTGKRIKVVSIRTTEKVYRLCALWNRPAFHTAKVNSWINWCIRFITMIVQSSYF